MFSFCKSDLKILSLTFEFIFYRYFDCFFCTMLSSFYWIFSHIIFRFTTNLLFHRFCIFVEKVCLCTILSNLCSRSTRSSTRSRSATAVWYCPGLRTEARSGSDCKRAWMRGAWSVAVASFLNATIQRACADRGWNVGSYNKTRAGKRGQLKIIRALEPQFWYLKPLKTT